MKDEYDFSNAEQGKFYIPIEEIELPIYLDKDLIQSLEKKSQESHQTLQTLVNHLLRNALKIEDIVTS